MSQLLTSVTSLVNAMTDAEVRTRLVEYMSADERLQPQPVGVEIRLSENRGSSRYDVLLLLEDGTEKPVKFRDRYSRLVYIYTLMHPEGYQRRFLQNDDYRALRQLYSQLYFTSAERLLKTIGSKFDQFFNQSVAQSRVAIRRTDSRAHLFEIASPTKHNGRTLIPAAATATIIDNTLL